MLYEVYRDEAADVKWRWRLIDDDTNITVANGKESYSTSQACIDVISLLQQTVDVSLVDGHQI